ncbi:SDR family NAD(P)-dependent oxidoreductase [Staphylococcus sp. ACRSN]|uniref:SDR family NAD(P)-dependent oxidoreductase n=1 Tax=Staphylococcus sp. ACRSN TaxID=2918214 RepID=UPI001EF1E9B8|nr:SDR family NAD(P)-dependent oxidoreductase [Staphylococcus sp. ACRSN]MCG7339363.1 SDR family NAD(P)-dependent oxidoreductase [Staphylococcus sp. ACRSN]
MANQKNILVTGATRGMGKEISKVLAAQGYHIFLGARNINDGKTIAEELESKGFSVTAVQLDVTDMNSVKYATREIPSLDILINNAGIALETSSPSKLDVNKVKKEFDVNVFGVMNVSSVMLPLLKKAEQAKIINISSMMGSLNSALDENSIVYGAAVAGYQSSKAALNMYTIQLAKELEKEGCNISVDLVDPGMVATEFGGLKPDTAKQMGAKSVDEGIRRVIELVVNENGNETITFTNNEGIVPW